MTVPFSPRRRRAQPKQAGGILAKTLEDLGLTDLAHRVRIVQVWCEAVGPELAARTEAHSFSRGVLTIKTHSAAWQNELTYMKETLIERINANLERNSVQDIRVISGGPPIRRKPESLRRLKTRHQQQISETSVHIKDPEIRRAFAELMEQQVRRIGIATPDLGDRNKPGP
ncbi:MAG: DciA family protein [Myxococcota bacterium]